MKNRASAKEKEENKHIKNHGEFKGKFRFLWFFIVLSVSLLFSLLSYAKIEGETLFSQGQIKCASTENGITVLLKQNHNLPLASLLLCVDSGSAQEGEFAGSGISHFVEHMVFKGSEKRGPGDVFQEVESFGGVINAYTSYDYTCYTITVPSEFTSNALEILHDLTTNAIFDKEELEKERNVILKEIRLNQDNPQRYASRLLWQTAYTTHPYKYPIIGEEEQLKKLSRDDLLKHYNTKYTPNKTTLAIVGDIEIESILAKIKDIYQDIKPDIPDILTVLEPKQLSLREEVEEFTAGLTYLLLGYHTVSINDKDLFALDVLAAILGSGESSRLYRLIAEKKKLVYSISAANYTPRDAGLFIISSLLEEKKRKPTLNLIRKQIKLIKKKKVTAEELDTAKNKIVSSIVFQNQTIEAQTQDIVLNEVLTGNFKFTEEYIRGIEQVTADAILSVANTYLKESNLNIVALTPKNKLSQHQSMHRTAKAPTIGVVGLGKEKVGLSVQKYTLDNGITLLISENREMPLISIRVAFKGGLRAENEDLNGISNLTAQMLEKGTKNRTAIEIAKTVESRGASLSHFSGNNSFGLSLDALSKDFEPMLELFADLIINPKFAQKELVRQKEKNIAAINNEGDNIFSSGNRLLKATLFKAHPFKFTTIGTERSLKKIKRQDLIDFHQQFCVSNNMVLSIFGDVNAQEIMIKVKENFAALKNRSAPVITTTEEAKYVKEIKKGARVLDKKQALVLFGFYGSTILSEDRYTMELLLQILSHPSGRLFTQLRGKEGLAYTLGAYPVLGLDEGYITIYVATTNENAGLARTGVLEQLRLLKEKGVSREELEKAKRALLGKKIIGRQTNSARAFESTLDDLYGLGYNNYLNYHKFIEKISIEDIKVYANKYFDLTNYAIVTISPENLSFMQSGDE